MTSITLLNMRARQGINSQFIFGRLGWALAVFELFGAASMIYTVIMGYWHTRASSLIFVIALVILISSSYLSAEKYLSAPENRYDLLMGIPAKEIFWAIYGQVCWSSLRLMVLFPLIIVAEAGTVSPWLMAAAFLVMPGAAALIACLLNILINRYWKRISGLFYILFSFLWVGGIAAIFSLSFARHDLSFAALSNRDVLFIVLLLSAAALAVLWFSSTVAYLWRESYLLDNTAEAARLPFQRFRRFVRFFSSSFTVKEWFLLWRNPVTKLRVAVWAILIMVCCFTSLRSYLEDPRLFLVITVGIWLLCYSEMPATAWQNEGEHKAFYWLAGLKPSRLIAVKILVFLPLAILSALTALFFGLAAHLSWALILQESGLAFLLAFASVIIALAVASLGYDGTRRTFDNVIFEQVPLTKSGMAAVAVEFLFCCSAFLPLHCLLVFSTVLPAILMAGQSIWFTRSCYS